MARLPDKQELSDPAQTARVDALESALAELEARRRAESALGETLSFALSAARMGSWSLDVATRGYEASDLCKANYGRRPDQIFTFENLVAAVHPGDRTRMLKAIETAIRDGSDYDIEYRAVIPTGEVRWVHVRGRADRDPVSGAARRMAGVSLDVTDRRRAEDRQQMLLNELNHRVKNTLAAVQSIAYQTLRSAASPAEFHEAFEARIMALSQTHNLLTLQGWESASLRDVIAAELEPFGGEGRAVIDRTPDVQLSPKAAVALGMAFHELATNAVKHGALSTPGGCTRAGWEVESDTLTLRWSERGGPPVKEPASQGFGSRLLQQGLAAELGGKVELRFHPEGLECTMKLPMAVLEGKE
ncbi:MAG: HWE histidine kinase domain-containing protein [Caulobacter sp.]|nr:HWE histidine kinase domain-containing protein [Caulobacter sp.]